MTAAEGFFGRWSRLKRRPEPSPAADEVGGETVVPGAVVPPEVADVPLEDIALWIRRGAPQIWAQAALRRLWVSDPTISTFIGPADYAWDWNTPGGVPGWGPMTALDDIGKLLARAVGEASAPEPVVQSQGLAGSEAETPEIAESREPPVLQVADLAVVVDEPQVPDRPHRRRGGGAMPA